MNLFSYLLILVATTRLLMLMMSHLVKDAIVLAYELFKLTLPHGIQAYLQELLNLRHYLKVKYILVVASWASAHILTHFII